MHLTRETVERWLHDYGQAWQHADPQRAAALFTDDCRYFETPFAPPAVGRDGVLAYWQAVPDGQADIAFAWRLVAVEGEVALAHWSASFTRKAGGTRVHLDGMFELAFDTGSGRCRTLREWWHAEERPAA